MFLKTRQRIANWLLRDVHLKDVRFGKNSVIVSDMITMDSQTPTEKGEIGMDTATGRPRFYDGSSARSVAHTADVTMQNAYDGSPDVSMAGEGLEFDTHADFSEPGNFCYRFKNDTGPQINKVFEVSGRGSSPYFAMNGSLSSPNYISYHIQHGGVDKIKMRWDKVNNKYIITTTTGDVFVMTAAGALTLAGNLNGRDIAADGVTLDALDAAAGTPAILWTLEGEVTGSDGNISITISGEDAADYLLVMIRARIASAAVGHQSILMTFNNDASGSDYDSQISLFPMNQTSVGGSGQDGQNLNYGVAPRMLGGTGGSTSWGVGSMKIFDPAGANRKYWTYDGWLTEFGAVNRNVYSLGGGVYKQTTAISSIQFGSAEVNDLEVGSKITIYGMGGA